jgi:hypothetical protein
LKKPALVVFCLMLAVSPCSAILTSALWVAVSLFTLRSSPVPFGLRLAGGTGGIVLWWDIAIPFVDDAMLGAAKLLVIRRFEASAPRTVPYKRGNRHCKHGKIPPPS